MNNGETRKGLLLFSIAVGTVTNTVAGVIAVVIFAAFGLAFYRIGD